MPAISENRRLWWDVVTGLCVVILFVAAAIKLFSGDIKFSVDFPTLLSLLLAFFSVGLSALFYFKATESSNSFYDNTYKFTTDISQLLARMDSGLGEKMNLLENRYGDLKDFMRSGSYGSNDTEAASDQINTEKAELEKVVKEKDTIIAQLIESSNLDEAEKDKIRAELDVKDSKIKELLFEVELLRSKRDWNTFSEASKSLSSDKDLSSKLNVPTRVIGYARKTALPRLEAEPHDILNFSQFSNLFSKKAKYLNEMFLADLERLGFIANGKLTLKGHEFFIALSL
ncbi:hypothetical protein IFT96_03595 [Pseudomonas fluorescens]|nr:hypothetical protein [Pseudomonas fluorescens]